MDQPVTSNSAKPNKRVNPTVSRVTPVANSGSRRATQPAGDRERWLLNDRRQERLRRQPSGAVPRPLSSPIK